jgi:predicted dinucleotide-binding enzyme
MQVSIIGAGNMAMGIATRALAGGHSVRLADRDPAKAKALAEELRERVAGAGASGAGAAGAGADVTGAGASVSSADGIGDGFAGADVVVLALPYAAAEEVAAAYRDELAGKVVVDISNPVDFATFDSLVVPAGTSAAELIAAAAPGARVVKAFNTTFAGNLVTGEAGGAPLDVFIAGDDGDAKQAVADLAVSGGLRPIDAGALKRARELEGFQFLHMTLQEVLGTNWSSAIKIVG